jgi:hypothetical protein
MESIKGVLKDPLALAPRGKKGKDMTSAGLRNEEVPLELSARDYASFQELSLELSKQNLLPFKRKWNR